MSETVTELWRMSATDLAEAIRVKQASSQEVIEAHLRLGIGDGLPQAVQVIGPRYREDLCLDAAAAVEVRLGIFTPIDPR